MSRKATLFTSCMVFVSLMHVFSQNTEIRFTPLNDLNTNLYKRVEITLGSNTDLETIARLGIDLHCGMNLVHQGDKHLAILELSAYEHDLLQANGLETRVLIDDLSTFVAERAKADLPKAQQQLQAAKEASMEKNVQVAQDLGCTEAAFPVPVNFQLGSMGGFITHAEMLSNLDQMRALYPNLISVKTPASTTITTHEGRTVYYVRISDNPDVDETEAEVLYTGVHHAREPLSMMNLLYYMWYLLENYATDPTVKRLVDNTEMYFIPIVNPDGYIHNEATNPGGGGYWRKNRFLNADGTYGVDPNRNYGFQWGLDNTGSSPTTSQQTYRGTAPFSEAETQIVRDFTYQHNFVNAFHNHAYSDLLLRSWGYTTAANPDEELFDEISEHMCWHNRYEYGNSSEVIYPTNGDANDWSYGEQTSKQKILAWTPEIGSYTEGGFWPSPTYILPQCQRQMKMSLLLAQSAANFGLLNDLTPYNIPSSNSTLTFNVEHLSLIPGSFTINVSSTSPYVASITNPVLNSSTLTAANFETLSTSFTLVPGTPAGATITFEVSLNNGTYDIYTTTIEKVYKANELFYDAANDLSNWTTSGTWGNNLGGYNGTGITDTPTGNMGTLPIRMELSTPLDLSSTISPVLEFYTKWDINRLEDYAYLEVSTDGSSWQTLCGEYMKPGGGNFQPTDGLYDGLQKEWVREQIDLSAYAGSNTLYLRFFLDGASFSNAKDGFYIDEIKVYGEANSICVSAKVFLQAAYNMSTMNTHLQAQNLLPMSEPYTAMGYTHVNGGGGEVMTTTAAAATGSSTVVDWVVMELRDPTNPATILATRAALLLSDSNIVDVDGVSPVNFELPSGMYHVAVRHRNHLAVMTATPVSL